MSVQREGVDLAKRVGVELAAAGMGLLAGGPLGAVVGSASTPIIELVLLRENRAIRKMEQLVMMVEQLAGVSSEEFLMWAQQSEGRLFLATMALQAATNARSEQKIQALARVVAENLGDDARLDLASLTVTALAELDPPHIQVLYILVHHVPPDVPAVSHQDPGWSCLALKDRLPGIADGIMPIVAVLSRTGMITETPDSTNERLRWAPTRFGIGCLNYLGDPA